MIEHKIRWFVVVDGERFPHTAAMRGSWPGWDATCSCGWDSRTGGSIKARITEAVWYHKNIEVGDGRCDICRTALPNHSDTCLDARPISITSYNLQ